MFSLDSFFAVLGVGALILAVSFLLPHRSSGVFDGHDFVFLWLFGGMAATPLISRQVSFLQTIVAMLTVAICHFALSKLSVVNSTAGKLISGRPIMLIKNGVVLRKNMRRALVPAWMLMAELRGAGLNDVSQVEFAILETCGKISIIPKSELWPVTARDLELKCTPEVNPLLLIEDGKVLDENLVRLNYDRGWLKRELTKQGVQNLSDVYLAGIDAHGNVYFSYRQ